jgi:hypothetical protein
MRMKQGKPSGLALAGLLFIAAALAFTLWGETIVETFQREFSWEGARATLSEKRDVTRAEATAQPTARPTTAPTAAPTTQASAKPTLRPTATPGVGLFNGYHEVNLPGGAVYKGNYVEGVRSGYGEYFYADGSCYKGEFRNNRFDGTGTLYDAEGAVILEGIWAQGSFVR